MAGPGDALFGLATLTLGHEEPLDDVVAGYGTDVDLDVIRFGGLEAVGVGVGLEQQLRALLGRDSRTRPDREGGSATW
ncbi:hypothetical protein SSOG_09058 [Streptomyces himastatinicus ATCC 53653]|uniref:Uncharacterized protein n=1 Tax=Streptomyces himastatinicus ATCC 53653 TaxID=457427 RepID=D9WL69_9ACTN|nr:hypothetical protein SSOG_09058 [Streptomyces himastatinicus ATCC 53653]